MSRSGLLPNLLRIAFSGCEVDGYAWAYEWKRRGGKVAGVLTPCVPVELLWAAGFLPWRVMGAKRRAVPISLALDYRPVRSCVKDTEILELVLSGELDFLDALISTDWDNDVKRLWDVWTSVRKVDLAYLLSVPRISRDYACEQLCRGFAELMSALETAAGVKITEEDLRRGIRLYNSIRSSIQQLYELRKRDNPPLLGAQCLEITLSGMVMPPQEFLNELSTLLRKLEGPETSPPRAAPRLLVSADWLDDSGFLKVIEDLGCLVAMDDLDTGSRFYWGQVNESPDGPLMDLARYYLQRPQCPRNVDWTGQVRQIREWVSEFRIDGVLELVLVCSPMRAFRSPYLKEMLSAAGVPFLSIEREYQLANVGQIRSRVEAFLEMIGK